LSACTATEDEEGLAAELVEVWSRGTLLLRREVRDLDALVDATAVSAVDATAASAGGTRTAASSALRAETTEPSTRADASPSRNHRLASIMGVSFVPPLSGRWTAKEWSDSIRAAFLHR
jgi:hypothetical protein